MRVELFYDECVCGHERQWHDMKSNGECRVDIADDETITCKCKQFTKVGK